MDSTESLSHPDGVIDLKVTLAEGPPIPIFLLADIQSRDGDENMLIETANMNVRLRTRGPSPANSDHERSILVHQPNEPTVTSYPGLNLDLR